MAGGATPPLAWSLEPKTAAASRAERRARARDEAEELVEAGARDLATGRSGGDEARGGSCPSAPTTRSSPNASARGSATSPRTRAPCA